MPQVTRCLVTASQNCTCTSGGCTSLTAHSTYKANKYTKQTTHAHTWARFKTVPIQAHTAVTNKSIVYKRSIVSIIPCNTQFNNNKCNFYVKCWKCWQQLISVQRVWQWFQILQLLLSSEVSILFPVSTWTSKTASAGHSKWYNCYLLNLMHTTTVQSEQIQTMVIKESKTLETIPIKSYKSMKTSASATL